VRAGTKGELAVPAPGRRRRLAPSPHRAAATASRSSCTGLTPSSSAASSCHSRAGPPPPPRAVPALAAAIVLLPASSPARRRHHGTDQREEQIDAKKRVVNSSRTDQSARDRNGKNKRKQCTEPTSTKPTAKPGHEKTAAAADGPKETSGSRHDGYAGTARGSCGRRRWR
jgi:hypothetical protein